MNPRTRRSTLALITLAGALLVSTGCGTVDGRPDGRPPLTAVGFRGPFVTSGGDAPFYYAQKLGYYAEEGIDVRISDSKGSSQTITDINAGGSDFGLAAVTNAILAIGQGQQVVGVATPVGRSSFGFFVPKSSGATSLTGLAGKSIAVTALVEPNMRAALAAAGVPKGAVKPTLADANAVLTTYVGGKVDALYTTALLAAAVQRRPSDFLAQADGGYNPPDYALLVKQSTLEQRPELVRGFVRATLRGFQAAKRDPQAAVDALLAKHPELNPPQALATLRAMLAFYCSPAQSGRPYGENAAADWTGAARALREFAGLSGSVDGARFFTNRLFEKEGGVDAGTC